MRVVIVGLPLFAQRLAKQLRAYDAHNSYTALDTYYNKWHKFRARLIIPKADVVFSINGSLTRSGVFDLAISKKIPLIMNWVGTDVLKAIEANKQGQVITDYQTEAIHFCEVEWIRDELSEVKITPEIVNFASFDTHFELTMPTGNFTVLTYISEGRAEFYGMKSIIRLAKENPSVDFLIAGTEAVEYKSLPENIKALGWVKNMGELFDKAHLCIRFPEHDGLSSFILEALARGKVVLYKYPFPFCSVCPDEDTLLQNFAAMKLKYDKGEWEVNQGGARLIREHFNSETILGGLVSRFKELSGK